MMMTVAPPVVQPSLGLMALMQGGDPGWRTQGENDGNPTFVRKEKEPLRLFAGALNVTTSVHYQMKTWERLGRESYDDKY